MSTIVTYAGVADCHGIESFNRKEDMDDMKRFYHILRADANRQRHAVYYEATIEREHVGVVEAYLKAEQYENALECLKRVAIEFICMPEHADSLELIPNPQLDP